MALGTKHNYKTCACLCVDGTHCTAHAHTEKGKICGMRICPFSVGNDAMCIDYYISPNRNN